MKNAINFLNKFTNGKNVLALFVFTQAVYLYIILFSIPNVSNHANGMKLFDIKIFGYSSEYAKLLLAQLGEAGRNAYLAKQMPIDMIYPILFAVSSSLIIIYFLKKKYQLENKIFLLVILPFLAGFFDYFENLGIITMLLSYPDFSYSISQFSSIFTVLKSILVTFTYLALLISLIVFAKNKKSAKKIST